MKRLLVSMALAVLVLALSGTAALAGEVTGNGTPKPVVGRSICAFSGLNDHVSPEEPDRTQSFGTIVRGFARAGMVAGVATTGIGGASGTTGVGVPGHACNPNIGLEE
jgi:hypothetical protein